MQADFGEPTVVQDSLAIAVISDAAICITVFRMSNDLRQTTFPRGADEHYICPMGKHGCAVPLHGIQNTIGEQLTVPSSCGRCRRCTSMLLPLPAVALARLYLHALLGRAGGNGCVTIHINVNVAATECSGISHCLQFAIPCSKH